MVDYAERLAGAMKHSGATKTTLANAIGISYQAVKKVLDGGSRSLSAENNAKAARFLGVSSHWLATGDGEMLEGASSSAAVAVSRPPQEPAESAQMSEKPPLILEHSSSNTFKHAPVVAWASLGEVLNRDNDEWPIEAMREIHTNKPVSRKTKWLEVQDDLLAPKVLKGDLVAVDPDGSPKLDSLVLAVAADGSYMLRFWRPLSGGQFELFDSAGRPMDSTRHGVRVVATFVTLQRDSL